MKASRTIDVFLLLGLLHGLCDVAQADEQGERGAARAGESEEKSAGESEEKSAGKQGDEGADDRPGPQPGEKAGTDQKQKEGKKAEPAGEARGGQEKAQGEKPIGPGAEKTKPGARPEPSAKQDRRQTGAAPAGAPPARTGIREVKSDGRNARFVDRDGDGIRDGQEHRFRGRHRQARRGQQGGEANQEQMMRHKYGADQAKGARGRGR
jgi:hypothetical protein